MVYMSNIVNSRVQHKKDSETNWNKQSAITPLEGELIVITTNSGVMVKVGDGSKTPSQLPYVTLADPDPVSIVAPTTSSSLTYNGTAQSPTWSNYDSAKLMISGDTQGTDAGTYVTLFSLKSGYKWSDGTYAQKYVSWSIRKGTPTLTLSSSSVTLDKPFTSTTITYTTTSDGAISVSSSNTNVVTAVLTATGIELTPGSTNGSATITVTAAATTNTSSVSKTISVTNSAAVSSVLNDNTWSTIATVASLGLANQLWSVGDIKYITITSTTVGRVTLSGTYGVYIIGFNHNGADNTIDFGTFLSSDGSKRYAITDTTVGSTTSSSRYLNMNTSATNSGGWNNCNMRSANLGSTTTKGADAVDTTASSPATYTLMKALPSDLRAVMKKMTTYADNGSGSMVASVDYLPLLAVYEIFGTTTNVNSAEATYLKQYSYYASGNSKINYRHNSTSSTVIWWTRSRYASNSTAFCTVSATGALSYTNANYRYGMAPIFRV